jgi:hypothetical protein
MEQLPAAEVVVVVKSVADEDMVTYLRVKLPISARNWRRRRTEHVSGVMDLKW